MKMEFNIDLDKNKKPFSSTSNLFGTSSLFKNNSTSSFGTSSLFKNSSSSLFSTDNNIKKSLEDYDDLNEDEQIFKQKLAEIESNSKAYSSGTKPIYESNLFSNLFSKDNTNSNTNTNTNKSLEDYADLNEDLQIFKKKLADAQNNSIKSFEPNSTYFSSTEITSSTDAKNDKPINELNEFESIEDFFKVSKNVSKHKFVKSSGDSINSNDSSCNRKFNNSQIKRLSDQKQKTSDNESNNNGNEDYEYNLQNPLKNVRKLNRPLFNSFLNTNKDSKQLNFEFKSPFDSIKNDQLFKSESNSLFGSIKNDQPFKSESKSLFDSIKNHQPFKSESKSLFDSIKNDQPFKSESNSLFGSTKNDQPFKSESKSLFDSIKNDQPFKSESNSLFGSTKDNQPLRPESKSLFGSIKDNLPFKPESKSFFDSIKDNLPFKSESKSNKNNHPLESKSRFPFVSNKNSEPFKIEINKPSSLSNSIFYFKSSTDNSSFKSDFNKRKSYEEGKYVNNFSKKINPFKKESNLFFKDISDPSKKHFLNVKNSYANNQVIRNNRNHHNRNPKINRSDYNNHLSRSNFGINFPESYSSNRNNKETSSDNKFFSDKNSIINDKQFKRPMEPNLYKNNSNFSFFKNSREHNNDLSSPVSKNEQINFNDSESYSSLGEDKLSVNSTSLNTINKTSSLSKSKISETKNSVRSRPSYGFNLDKLLKLQLKKDDFIKWIHGIHKFKSIIEGSFVKLRLEYAGKTSFIIVYVKELIDTEFYKLDNLYDTNKKLLVQFSKTFDPQQIDLNRISNDPFTQEEFDTLNSSVNIKEDFFENIKKFNSKMKEIENALKITTSPNAMTKIYGKLTPSENNSSIVRKLPRIPKKIKKKDADYDNELFQNFDKMERVNSKELINNSDEVSFLNKESLNKQQNLKNNLISKPFEQELNDQIPKLEVEEDSEKEEGCLSASDDEDHFKKTFNLFEEKQILMRKLKNKELSDGELSDSESSDDEQSNLKKKQILKLSSVSLKELNEKRLKELNEMRSKVVDAKINSDIKSKEISKNTIKSNQLNNSPDKLNQLNNGPDKLNQLNNSPDKLNQLNNSPDKLNVKSSKLIKLSKSNVEANSSTSIKKNEINDKKSKETIKKKRKIIIEDDSDDSISIRNKIKSDDDSDHKKHKADKEDKKQNDINVKEEIKSSNSEMDELKKIIFQLQNEISIMKNQNNKNENEENLKDHQFKKNNHHKKEIKHNQHVNQLNKQTKLDDKKFNHHEMPKLTKISSSSSECYSEKSSKTNKLDNKFKESIKPRIADKLESKKTQSINSDSESIFNKLSNDESYLVKDDHKREKKINHKRKNSKDQDLSPKKNKISDTESLSFKKNKISGTESLSFKKNKISGTESLSSKKNKQENKTVIYQSKFMSRNFNLAKQYLSKGSMEKFFETYDKLLKFTYKLSKDGKCKESVDDIDFNRILSLNLNIRDSDMRSLEESTSYKNFLKKKK